MKELIPDISKISPAEFVGIISDGFWQKANHLKFLDE
jgi:hypothetical protein